MQDQLGCRGCPAGRVRIDIETERGCPSPEVDEAARAIPSVPIWRADGDYRPQDWEALRRAAVVVQRAQPEHVTEALSFYMRHAPNSPRAHAGSRPHLLMRMVFELPARLPREGFHFYGGWIGSEAAFSGGTVNPSWPIRWDGGTPVLVGRFEGLMGPGYQAEAEYRALLSRYPMRDLGRVRIAGLTPGADAEPEPEAEDAAARVERGQPWPEVAAAVARLNEDRPPRHAFTARGEGGEELMCTVASFSGRRLLLLFKGGGLERIAEYPPTHWREIRPGYVQGLSPTPAEVRAAALAGPPLPFEGLGRYARWARVSRATYQEYDEPLPPFAVPLTWFGREPVQEQRAAQRALAARFDGTKVRLGQTAREVESLLGAPRETRAGAGGEHTCVYGELADLGWYSAPQVVVTYRDGEAVEVSTEHYSHNAEEGRRDQKRARRREADAAGLSGGSTAPRSP